ncbi:MAG: alpha/beta hydrolase [Deltaproteobacteria bacterium]
MSLERVNLGAVELEYETVGTGQAVLLIHGGVFADWFQPLFAEPVLQSYRLVRYRREGYGGSGHGASSPGIAEQAAQACALLQHLGIEQAHVVGHSSGGSIALQLARAAPHRVSSLALLEPVLMQVPSGPGVAAALELYAKGEPCAAIDCFLRAVAGADSAQELSQVLPHALDQARIAAPTFFGRELPASREWAFGAEDAEHVRQPVLAVLGAKSDAARGMGSAVFTERHQLLLRWFPHAESRILPGVTHLMLVQEPSGVARCLADFFSRSREGSTA